MHGSMNIKFVSF